MRLCEKWEIPTYYFGRVLFALCLVALSFTLTNTAHAGTRSYRVPREKKFAMVEPGGRLPGERECAQRVERNGWEPRPDNDTPNHQVPDHEQLSRLTRWGPLGGLNPHADSLRKRITGNFTGTTDEIIQWVACKWGFDEDIIRAQSITESHWHQHILIGGITDRSLCPPETWDGRQCTRFFGMLQVSYTHFRSAWPMMYAYTAFSLEFAVAVMRTCYEGWTDYAYAHIPSHSYPRYSAGDIWGCVGFWYSGWWYSTDSFPYIHSVKDHLKNRDWLKSVF